MLKKDETEKALNKFGKNVVKQSRANLTRNNINASRTLYDSLDYNLKVSPNSIEFSFEMEEHGEFIDSGVSGTKKKYNTPFSYKNKRPPADVLADYPRNKGFRPRNKKTGKFITKKSAGFAIANHVFKNGIKPTKFFSKPFENEFNKLPDELTEAFGLDVENFLKLSLKNG
jgi:hypothetical protein